MSNVSNDLIEAYRGCNDIYDRDGNIVTTPRHEVELAILKMTPEERLHMYCQWNGIIGYTNRLFKIANGEV